MHALPESGQVALRSEGHAQVVVSLEPYCRGAHANYVVRSERERVGVGHRGVGVNLHERDHRLVRLDPELNWVVARGRSIPQKTVGGLIARRCIQCPTRRHPEQVGPRTPCGSRPTCQRETDKS